ncbi:MAG: hypothetical protein ACM3US_00755 [Sphingomonadaceae bacterium]
MRVYCRPGATPLERLEALTACYLRSKPEIPGQVADLLIWATGCGPAREGAVRAAFRFGCVPDPAEALGMARAVLLLCGIAPEYRQRLTGRPRRDLTHLLQGRYRHHDPASPEAYALPSLLDAYCHMGAGFARGVDRVFQAVTGRPLAEHLQRAFALLEPAVSSEASAS